MSGTPAKGPWRRGLLWEILVNALLPYATYLVLTRAGFATVPALVAGAAFPAIAALITGRLSIRRRRWRIRPFHDAVLTSFAPAVTFRGKIVPLGSI
jgi:hypothetical protein